MTSPQQSRLALLLVIGLAIAAYWPIFDAGYAFDDLMAVQRNPLVNGEAPATEAFTRNFWGDQPGHEHMASWRPLTVLALRVQYGLGSGSPTVLHAANLLWHLLLVSVMWWTAGAFGAVSWVRASATALVALGGANAEAVASIVGQGDLLAATLATAGATLLLRPHDGQRSPRLVGAAAAALLAALLAKETAVLVVLPVAIVVATQQRWREVAVIAVTVAVWYGLRASAVGHLGGDVPAADNPLVTFGFGERLAAGAGIVGHYGAWTLFGRPAAADYTAAVPLDAVLYVLLGVAITAATAALAWFGRHRPEALFGALVSGASIALLSGVVVTLPAPLAGRYGPWWGVAVAWLVVGWASARPAWAARIAIGASIVAALGIPTAWRTAAAWQSELSLFEHSVEVAPQSARAWTNLGVARTRAGRQDEASAAYKTALAQVPDYYEALWRLADLERDHRKDLNAAWMLAERARKVATENAHGARLSLCATALAGGGPRSHPEETLHRCQQAVGDDDQPGARLLLARALLAAGRTRQGAALFEQLRAQHPDDDDIKGHYIGVLARTGRVSRAIALQREMLAQRPTDEQRKRNLVALLMMEADVAFRAGNAAAACNLAREAHGLAPVPAVKQRLDALCGPGRTD